MGRILNLEQASTTQQTCEYIHDDNEPRSI
jgi:hypothetical protein